MVQTGLLLASTIHNFAVWDEGSKLRKHANGHDGVDGSSHGSGLFPDVTSRREDLTFAQALATKLSMSRRVASALIVGDDDRARGCTQELPCLCNAWGSFCWR